MTARTEKSIVIIPTYNEAVGIIPVVDEVLSLPRNLHVLVVDDASPDGTAGLIEAHPAFQTRLHLIKRMGKFGLGTAYREGFNWALQQNYTTLIQMDADHSHNPQDIPRLLEEIDQGTDLALGSRYINGVRVLNWPMRRLFMSTFAGFYTRVLTGLPFADPTSGFKAIYHESLRRLPWTSFTSNGYSFQEELHFYLWHTGASCKEIPIIFTERREGQSKLSWQTAPEAAWRVLTLAFEKLWRGYQRSVS